VTSHQRCQGLQRSRDVVPGLEGIDHRAFEELAGVVYHRDLAAGADARVDRQRGQHAGGRRKQQVLEILAEYFDRLFIRAVLQFEPHFGLDRRVEEPVVRIRDSLLQVRHPFPGRPDHLRAQPRQRLFFLQLDLEGEHAFLCAAADREHPMRRDFAGGFAILRVHLELAFGVLDSFDGAAGDDSVGHHLAADRLAKRRVLADPLRDNVPGAFERFLFRSHAERLVHECR
jgi:hypothetical protein